MVRSESRCSRPAKIAASLQMFARSAPVRPLVWRATKLEVDVLGERLAARVHVEDRAAALEVGRRDEDLAVEAARAAAARGRACRAGWRRRSRRPRRRPAKPSSSTSSWLSVWSFSPGDVVAARGADGVELVDEDDRRRRLARLRGTAAGCGRRRGRRTSRRTTTPTGRRTWRSTRARRPWRAASCRCRAGRAAGCPSAPSRRARGSAWGRAGTPRPRAARPWPPRRRPRPPSVTELDDDGLISCGFVRGMNRSISTSTTAISAHEDDRQPDDAPSPASSSQREAPPPPSMTSARLRKRPSPSSREKVVGGRVELPIGR